MKRVISLMVAALTAMTLTVTASATEQDGLDLIAAKENYQGIIAEAVNEQIHAERERIAAEKAAAERAERERQERAKRAAVVQTAATDESYEGAYYLGTCEITAYCACSICCGKSDGITATGTTATQGRTVAVDPSVIPYGSVVIINGHEYIAEDCGGGIGGTQIDMFFNDHQDALNWGRRWLDVWVREA